jgi:hypothetical protein
VQLPVVFGAKPYHLQWFRVIFVVAVASGIAAHHARQPHQSTRIHRPPQNTSGLLFTSQHGFDPRPLNHFTRSAPMGLTMRFPATSLSLFRQALGSGQDHQTPRLGVGFRAVLTLTQQAIRHLTVRVELPAHLRLAALEASFREHTQH